MTLESASTLSVSPPVIEEDTTSHFITKEKSLSLLCVPRIQEHRKQKGCTSANHHFLPSLNSIPKKQSIIVNESIFPSDSPQSQRILQEDDENALHGSSEFMLVLYPEDETRKENINDMENSAEIRVRGDISKYENF